MLLLLDYCLPTQALLFLLLLVPMLMAHLPLAFTNVTTIEATIIYDTTL